MNGVVRRENGSQTLRKKESGLIVGPFWAGKKAFRTSCQGIGNVMFFSRKGTCCGVLRGHRVRAVVVGLWSVMLVCVHCDCAFVSIAFTNRASLMK